MTGALQASLATGSPGGGGGGGGTAPVTITPATKSTTSLTNSSNTSTFNAAFSGSPSSIVWSLENIVNGSANVFSGQGTANAQITVHAADPDTAASCTIRCTAIIGGVSYSATATKSHMLASGGGGGP